MLCNHRFLNFIMGFSHSMSGHNNLIIYTHWRRYFFRNNDGENVYQTVITWQMFRSKSLKNVKYAGNSSARLGQRPVAVHDAQNMTTAARSRRLSTCLAKRNGTLWRQHKPWAIKTCNCILDHNFYILFSWWIFTPLVSRERWMNKYSTEELQNLKRCPVSTLPDNIKTVYNSTDWSQSLQYFITRHHHHHYLDF